MDGLSAVVLCRLGSIHCTQTYLQVEVWIMKFAYGMERLQSVLDHVISVMIAVNYDIRKVLEQYYV